MDKAAREKARELAERRKEAMKSWSLGGMAHDKELADACLPLLDALDAADADNARLQARVAELEAAQAKSENILARNLGHQTEKCYDALEIIRDTLFPGLRLPAPPVGDR